MRLLLELIEPLLLVAIQDLADLFVGLVAQRPHMGQALVARLGLVVHKLLRGVVQILEDRFDCVLLFGSEIKLRGQQLQMLFDGWHAIAKSPIHLP